MRMMKIGELNMSLTKKINKSKRPLKRFFDQYLGLLHPLNSRIDPPSLKDWRSPVNSYFRKRNHTVLSKDDFYFSWTNPQLVRERLSKEGYGNFLNDDLLNDLLFLHEEMQREKIQSRFLSQTMYVMF